MGRPVALRETASVGSSGQDKCQRLGVAFASDINRPSLTPGHSDYIIGIMTLFLEPLIA